MKKRILSLFLIVCILFVSVSMFPMGASAATNGTCGDNLTWTFDAGTLIISGTGNMYDWTSYSSVPWYSVRGQIKTVKIDNGVTSIGDWAFSNCDSLTSITIPDSVTSIGDYAFSSCDGLTSVTIGNSVTSIGVKAFYVCESLTSIIIPDSVTSIGGRAFSYCESLTSVTIPDSVTSIGDDAFFYCESLSDVYYSSSESDWEKISIGYNNECLTNANIHYDCGTGTNISSGTCGDNLTWTLNDVGTLTISGTGNMYDYDYYGNYAPWYSVREQIKTVKIDNNVTSIGESAFAGCDSLKNITIPDRVTSIGDLAFSYCDGLTSVTIGNSVTSIGKNAFYYCESLTSITIPDSVTSIGERAFSHCYSLTSITIPDSVTSIGENAFSSCDGLTSVTIGNSVTSIGDYAFSNCESLTSITIPDSVTSIGGGAFSSCYSLTSITIPDSVTRIGDDAFYNCNGLTSITIPDSVTSIGEGAFSYCDGLTSITIPDSVTSIGEGAFSSCTSLTSIEVSSDNANYTSVSGLLFSKNKTSLIAYPAGKKDTKYIIPDSVTSIGDGAFSGSSLINVTIPNSVTSIGYGAFSYCKSLTSITIPDSVTSIGDRAFYYCYSLTSVTIGNSITSIGDSAFEYCGLTSITIPDSVTSIGYRAFSQCYRLKDVYYSGSMTDWEKISMGSGNTYLTKATIHYNYVQKPIYVPSQNVNINTNSDPAHMPVNINMVTINGKGTAYGRYKIQKNDGSVAKKQKVYYCVNGGTKTAVYTDDYGYATVEIPGITKSANYNISFSGNGIIPCEGILIVTVELLHFKSECEAEVSANLKASVGLDAKAEFGKLQAKAGIGSVGGDGSTKSTLSFAQEYINGKNKLVISSKTNLGAAVNGKLGLFAEVGHDKFAGLNIDPLSVSGKAGYENFLGVGFEDEDFSFSDSGDILDVANFLLNVYVTNTQGNIVGKYVANVLNTPINYYETGSSICLEKGGNIGAVELEFGKSKAKGEVTLGGISSKSVWTNSTKTMKDNSREYSSGIVAEGGTKLYDITIGYSKAKSSLGSMKDFISDNLMISATKNKDGELEELTLSSKQEGEDGGFIYSKTETTGKNITYKNEAAQKIVSGNSELKKFASGDKAYFSKDQMKNVIDTMLNSGGSGEFCKTEQVKEAISLDISAGGGALISFGGGYGISGAFSYEYDSESGIYENGTAYIQAKNEIADEVEYYVITMDDIWQQTKSTVNSILEGIMDTVKGLADGVVEFGKAVAQKTKNTVTGWVISITKTSTPVKSMKILAVEDEFALFSTSSLATTIGEPYIISVEDKNGNEVVDFTQNPISLTLSYSEEDLQDANVTDVSNISAVWWDDEKCVYVKQDGLLDEENSCVVLEITKPGQYVLAIDDCAPAITQFEVNGGGELPDVYAVVSDMSGIADFTFSIDGEEVLDKSDFEEYYNHVTGEFAYRAKDLSDGEHTATIYAKDTFGNETEKTIIFNTDNTVPEITNVTAVPEVITEDLIISANVTNAHESGVLLNAEYTDIYGSAQTLTVDMVEKDGKYTASLPEISNGYNVKIWISAFSESGNESESEKQEAIVMKSEDGEPVIAITKIKDESVTLRCFGISSFKDISAHIGVYDENGKLLMVKSLPLAQEVTFSGVTQKGIVKAFLWDKNLSPVVLPVCAQSQKQE